MKRQSYQDPEDYCRDHNIDKSAVRQLIAEIKVYQGAYQKALETLERITGLEVERLDRLWDEWTAEDIIDEAMLEPQADLDLDPWEVEAASVYEHGFEAVPRLLGAIVRIGPGRVEVESDREEVA